jgi:hypothetical protein
LAWASGNNQPSVVTSRACRSRLRGGFQAVRRLLLGFSNVEDPTSARLCQWASDRGWFFPASEVLIPCFQLLVCVSFIACGVFDLSGSVVPLQIHALLEWHQLHWGIKRRYGQLQVAVLFYNGARDSYLHAAEVITAVGPVGELFGPVVEIRQALIVKVDFGCRVLGICDWPYRRNSFQLFQGLVRPAPNTPPARRDTSQSGRP